MERDGYELVRRLGLATVKADGAYYLLARKLGIKENELNVLYALDDGEPHTQKQICGDWLLPKTTVNMIVRELVKEGYAELLPSAAHEKAIRLTEAGLRYAGSAMERVHAAERAALERTAAKFSTEFINAMEYFTECLCEEMSARSPR